MRIVMCIYVYSFKRSMKVKGHLKGKGLATKTRAIQGFDNMEAHVFVKVGTKRHSN